MSKINLSSEVDRIKNLPEFKESNWNSINPEYAGRMVLQNQFKTGIDIAKYTSSIMRKDMKEYDNDPSSYTS